LKFPRLRKENVMAGKESAAAALTRENDKMSKLPERKETLPERNTSRRRVPSRPSFQRQAAFKAHKGKLEQICMSYEQIVDPNFRPDDDRTSFTGW
jgi:hypothetical protein